MKKVVQCEPTERGQSMVELALTITFLMILLAGTIDFGRAFFTWIEMRDAAQEGASYASICPTQEAEVENRVLENLNSVYSYTVDYTPPSQTVGLPITITVDTAIPITMPFLGTVLDRDSISITATINDTVLTTKCPPPTP